MGEDLVNFFYLSLSVCKQTHMAIHRLFLWAKDELYHMKKLKCPNPPGSPLQAGVESNHTRRGDSFMPLPLVKPSVVLRFLVNTWPAPMAHSYRLRLVTWRYQDWIPVGPDICHHGCAYTVLQTVQRPGVYSVAYGTVHYKEALKSFEIRVGHSPGFRLPSVVILPWLCRKRRKAIFIFIQRLSQSSSQLIACYFFW